MHTKAISIFYCNFYFTLNKLQVLYRPHFIKTSELMQIMYNAQAGLIKT